MKVKVLQDFKYSLDGIKPTSFKKGDITRIFDGKTARKLMDRKWVGVKGSKAAPVDPEKLKAAEKVKAEKAEAAEKVKIGAEKLKARKKEILEAGAKFEDNTYSWPSGNCSEEELLAPDDEEWTNFINYLIEETKKENSGEDSANSDKSFEDDAGLGTESETNTDPEKNK